MSYVFTNQLANAPLTRYEIGYTDASDGYLACGSDAEYLRGYSAYYADLREHNTALDLLPWNWGDR